jgi:hypothetical protein
MDANNVVLLLNELEDLGYTTRLRDPRRSPAPPGPAHPAGRRGAELAERAQEAIEDDVLQALDADERATLWRAADRARALEPTTAPSRAPIEDYSATIASIST